MTFTDVHGNRGHHTSSIEEAPHRKSTGMHAFITQGSMHVGSPVQDARPLEGVCRIWLGILSMADATPCVRFHTRGGQVLNCEAVCGCLGSTNTASAVYGSQVRNSLGVLFPALSTVCMGIVRLSPVRSWSTRGQSGPLTLLPICSCQHTRLCNPQLHWPHSHMDLCTHHMCP